jgi:hypothetical protein
MLQDKVGRANHDYRFPEALFMKLTFQPCNLHSTFSFDMVQLIPDVRIIAEAMSEERYIQLRRSKSLLSRGKHVHV